MAFATAKINRKPRLSADDVASCLKSARHTQGGYIACCPAHDDSNASLSVSRGDKGGVVIKCFAGCKFKEICAALDIEEYQLMPDDGQDYPPRHHVSRPAASQPKKPAAEAEKPTVPGKWPDIAKRQAAKLTDALRKQLAERLGLPVDALNEIHLLGAGMDDRYKNGKLQQFWGFPETDPQGNIIGITRRYFDGEKRAMDGGKRGLTLPVGWRERAIAQGVVLCPEGGSDSLTLAYAGLPVVGRFSVSGKPGMLAAVLESLPPNVQIVLVGEHDEKPDGRKPGLDSLPDTAAGLSGLIHRPVSYAPPPKPHKDARAYLTAKVKPTASREEWVAVGMEFLNHLLANAERYECLGDGNPGASPGGAPLPPPTYQPIQEFEPFPIEVLPPPVAKFVQAASDSIGCDSSLVAVPALVAIAGAIGNSRAIQLKQGWSEPPVLWGMSVGESGTSKTPAYSAALKPLQDAQMEEFARHEKEVVEYRKKLAEAKKAKKDKPRKKRKKKEDENSEEPPLLGLAAVLEQADPEEIPTVPAPPIYWVSDATIEAVGEALRDNPRGVTLARDELDAWFSSFTKYAKGGGSDRAHWLELAQAGHLNLLRITRETGRRLSVRRAMASVVGTIQPTTLAKALDSDAFDSGLAARFIFAMPPRRKAVWSDAEISQDVSGAYNNLILGLLGLKLQDESKRTPHFIGLSKDAKTVYQRYFNELAENQFAAEGPESAWLAKLRGFCARLALILHVAGKVAVDEDDTVSISPSTVEDAIRLCRWLDNETQRVYGVLRESETSRSIRTLAEWIEGRPDRTTTVREVQNSNSKKYPTADDARAALTELVKAGVGDWQTREPTSAGGRRSEIFTLRPTVRQNLPDCTRHFFGLRRGVVRQNLRQNPLG